MVEKKRILLNWDVARFDLFQPFLELKDEFEFIILWRSSYSPLPYNYPFKEIFFQSFKTPYQVLEEVKPDKIIFFSIDSFPQIALNLAARNKKIPTYTLHHGVYTSDGLKINQYKEAQGMLPQGNLSGNKSTLLFYFSALQPKNINQLARYCYYAWLRKRRNALVAMSKCVFSGRQPCSYIQLSPHNAIVTRQVDHLMSDEKFIYIGHPGFDKIFDAFNKLKKQGNINTEKYFLLIDFPNIPSNLAFKVMGIEGKQAFYKRLSALAKTFGCRLKIKLHPAGFDSPYNYKDENIDLIKGADIASLIHGAEKCFSFYSTLVIPIIFEKRFCYLFNVGMDIQIQNEFVELGVGKLLNHVSFTENDLDINTNSVSTEGYELFINRYIYYTDGKATDRLKEILQSEAA